MKLQDICEKIRLRHDSGFVLGDDFIIKTMLDNIPQSIINDSILGDIDLDPFEEMFLWQVPSLNFEPENIFQEDYGTFESGIVMPYDYWPATFADIVSK